MRGKLKMFDANKTPLPSGDLLKVFSELLAEMLQNCDSISRMWCGLKRGHPMSKGRAK